MLRKPRSFSFGENWETFIRANFNEERVQVAQNHLLEFLNLTDLQGKTFLDIGCGSGLHSLAAFQAGAAKVISFDYDTHSVAATETIRRMHAAPAHWTICHGSILDDAFVASLERADIVYSWGVLHHTGNLWKAVKNASTLLRPDSLFYIAIYEKKKSSGFWTTVKKIYNRSPLPVKKLMEFVYGWNILLRSLSPATFKASLEYIRDYQKNRGMEYWTDVRDWLGGWPYEPATVQEVCSFCENELGLERKKIRTGQENIEYLYMKKT